jgi:prepilin-type N-terminal cleavage/methylation domain-containing protein
MTHLQTKNYKLKTIKEGFTLIESVVAISVLVTALVGPMTLAAHSISAQKTAKNTLIAANLAQEGIEFVKWYRDNNVLQEMAKSLPNNPAEKWLDGLDSCRASMCGVDGNRLQDIDGDDTNGFQVYSLPLCDGATSFCALMFDSSKQYVLCDSGCTGGKTPFSRTIHIIDKPKNNTTGSISVDPDEVEVVVTVTWTGGSKVFRARLYAW